MKQHSQGAPQGKIKHKIGFGLVFLLVVILATLSFIPLVDSNRWWIRLLDFPRLQWAIALLILTVPVLLYIRYFRKMAGLALILIASALGYHVFILLPYFETQQALPADQCPTGHDLSVMIANVKMRNDPEGQLVDLVREVEPDLFLAMETNEKWDEALATLEAEMPHTVSHVSDSTFGIHLFSRLPLQSPEIRFLAGQSTPQVVTGVTLASGETVDFLGVHPRPPIPSELKTTLSRDAVLYKAALLLREGEGPGLVAGDFNATPWESAVHKMRRIGNLKEPRRGYGYLATFNARSWWMSWPLDHIFYEPGFVIVSLDRLSSFGSDHYPYVGRLCRIGEQGSEAQPQAETELIQEARQTIEAAKEGG